jgi:hypothetical protein
LLDDEGSSRAASTSASPVPKGQRSASPGLQHSARSPDSSSPTETHGTRAQASEATVPLTQINLWPPTPRVDCEVAFPPPTADPSAAAPSPAGLFCWLGLFESP